MEAALGNFIFLTGPLLQDGHNLEWEQGIDCHLFNSTPWSYLHPTTTICNSWHRATKSASLRSNKEQQTWILKPIEPTIRVWTANKVLTSIIQKFLPWVSHSYNCLYQLRINIATIHIDSSPDGGLRGHSHMYLAFTYGSLPPLLLGARPHALLIQFNC